MTRSVCFYHRKDLDGRCSGAIVRWALPSVILKGVDYSDFRMEDFALYDPVFLRVPEASLDWGKETFVFVVDFSFPPNVMRHLSERYTLVWIDHHKSAIERVANFGSFEIAGIRSVEQAACSLTWVWMTQNIPYLREKLGVAPRPLPSETPSLAVELLSHYDIGASLTSPWVLPFQYWTRSYENGPESPIWEEVFQMDLKHVGECVLSGTGILRFAEADFERLMVLYGYVAEFFGYTALCLNTGTSAIYEHFHHPYDILFLYVQISDGRFVCTIASKTLDCSVLAHNFPGGGGHKFVAGFDTRVLPLKFVKTYASARQEALGVPND